MEPKVYRLIEIMKYWNNIDYYDDTKTYNNRFSIVM